jgi:hypothetical protein
MLLGFHARCIQRIRDTPLSESGFTGAGIGAAMAGTPEAKRILHERIRYFRTADSSGPRTLYKVAHAAVEAWRSFRRASARTA